MNKYLVFFIGLQLDVIGVALLISIGLGASPFGLFISNLHALIPIYIGAISFSYDTLALLIAKVFTKRRFYYPGLLYGLIFAGFLQLYSFLFSEVDGLGLIFRILLVVLAIVILDTGKYFLYNGKGPKLSTAVLIYALHQRFSISLNYASKVIVSLLIIISVMISAFHDEGLFYQLGIVTFVYFIVSGYTLKFLEQHNIFGISNKS